MKDNLSDFEARARLSGIYAVSGGRTLDLSVQDVVRADLADGAPMRLFLNRFRQSAVIRLGEALKGTDVLVTGCLAAGDGTYTAYHQRTTISDVYYR